MTRIETTIAFNMARRFCNHVYEESTHWKPNKVLANHSAQYRKWRSIARVKEAAKAPDFLPIDNGKEYRKVDGIWYFHEFSEVETKTPVFLRGAFYDGIPKLR
jgi:hypothetical protein